MSTLVVAAALAFPALAELTLADVTSFSVGLDETLIYPTDLPSVVQLGVIDLVAAYGA